MPLRPATALPRRRGGRARTITALLATLIMTLMLLLIAAWAMGRILSDRWGWSQWLLWVPTPAALAAAVVATLAAMLPRIRRRASRRGRVRFWTIMTMLIAGYFALIEHRLLRSAPAAPGTGGLRLVHWNTDPHKYRPPQPDGRPVIELDGDVTILTNGLEVMGDPAVAQWLGPGATAAMRWPFLVLTRLPVLRLEPLVSADEIEVTLLEVDAREALGRPIVIYMVDLPSNPRWPRAATAARARRLLESIEPAPPAPDLVVGDFNMTRGGAALGRTFPGFQHAYDQAGHGYGASFRRDWPLYHIDHVLLGPNLRAARYDLIDTGQGRHRAQAVVLKPQG